MIYAAIIVAALLGFSRYLKWRTNRRGALLGSPIPPWRDQFKARLKYGVACLALAAGFVVPILSLASALGAKT